MLNAGWNLQGNGSAVDFVKPYDTVNFVNGTGTTAVVGSDGNVSTVTYNVNVDNKTTEITYVDADGNAVTKVGDKFYKSDDLDEKGAPKTGATAVDNVTSQISAKAPTFTANADAANASTSSLNFVDTPTTTVNVDGNNVTVEVNTGTITAEPKGSVTGPVTTTLTDALKTAQEALAALPDTATEAEKKAAQDAVDAAQTAINNAGSQVATAQNVADAINKSGFTLKADKTDGDNLTADTLKDGELINPGDTVTMQAGKNMTVKQEANGKVTYATKDDVNFNSVEVGKAEPTYKDKDGNELVKVGDNFYKKDDYTAAPDKADGSGKDLTGLDTATVDNAKSDAPVKLTSDKGVATKDTTLGADGKTETTTAKDAPSALSVKDSLGENSQINGIASALDTKEVATKPLTVDADGNPVADKQTGKDKLVDLTAPTDEAEKAKWESSAVTVGDVANMGWIVSASGNEYTDTVKNKVDFKGENGISVTGKTTADGVREITVSLEKGEVIGANEGTVKIDGKDTDVVKVGDEYFKKEDIDPTTGKPKDSKVEPLAENIVGKDGANVDCG